MYDDLRDLKFNPQQKEFILRRLKAARHVSRQQLPVFLEAALISNFESDISFFPILAFPIHFEGEFQRVIINRTVREKQNVRLTDYTQLKYPPLKIEHKLPFNRASLKGQSVFYAGAGNLPSILETRPGLGDLYTVSKWRQKKDTLINHFPIFYHQAINYRPEFEKDWEYHNDFLKTLTPDVSEVVSEFLNFMTEVFIKEVNRDDKFGYIFSSMFSNYYLTKALPQVHCIYYPSVASEYVASNIACLPKTLDDYFECVDVKECLCTHHNGSKQWLSKRIAEARNINPKAIGKIEWELHISEEEYKNLKQEYNLR
ncbi:MAG TPA: hypothetical protein VI548_07300 [Chitinophagaceae bacterium]|nr:hypothetical protein [Chitinophagaceae bacterium]